MKCTLAILNKQLYECNYCQSVSRETSYYTVITLMKKQLENTGIDPVTSRMLSEHSTI